MRTDIVCGSCYFFQPNPGGKSFCRRFPPQMTMGMQTNRRTGETDCVPVTMYPEVLDVSPSCGEFRNSANP